ncbi:hypothetical protein BB561_004724 [Smittium simulii]|uniref:Uncharacterized protein n=1 Tax=Smittium simulii TaxID=133385 RepID=A0A2T9YEK8_9FUNG|nr:hypothetical protein BB561_004724 [Smittium simulii]
MGDYSQSATFRDFGILPPNKRQATLGQINNEFVNISDGQDVDIHQFVRGGGVVFPHLKIPSDIKVDLTEHQVERGIHSQDKAQTGRIAGNSPTLNKNSNTMGEESDTLVFAAIQCIIEFLFPINFLKTVDLEAIMRDSQVTKQFVDFYTGLSTNSTMGKIVVFLVHFIKLIENIIVFTIFGALGPRNGSGGDSIDKRSNRETTNSKAIKFVAWHPNRSLLALVPSCDASDNNGNVKLGEFIMLYDFTTNSFIENIFYNADIGEIKGICWKPNGGYTLVVNGELGACLFRFVADSNQHQSSNNNMSSLKVCWIENLYLNENNKRNQDGAVATNSSGSLVVLGHNCDNVNSFIVVDTDTQQKTVIKRGNFVFGLNSIFGAGSRSSYGIGEFSFSPNGQYLITSHYGTNEMRLWTTTDWSSQVFDSFPGLPGCFNWLPNNKGCFFNVKGDSNILTLLINQHGKSGAALSVAAQIAKVGTFNTHMTPTIEPEKDMFGQTEQIRVGGPIAQMVLDPSGHRLAISFDREQDMTSDTSLIAVYNVNYNAMLTAGGSQDSGPSSILIPSGYIRGPNWGSTTKESVKLQLPSPENLLFVPNYTMGSLLLVTWANGTIGFYQMNYN